MFCKVFFEIFLLLNFSSEVLPEAVCGTEREGVRVRQGQEWWCDFAALGVKAGRSFDKMFVVVHSLDVLVPHSA